MESRAWRSGRVNWYWQLSDLHTDGYATPPRKRTSEQSVTASGVEREREMNRKLTDSPDLLCSIARSVYVSSWLGQRSEPNRALRVCTWPSVNNELLRRARRHRDGHPKG
jgi:hypothetical protein